MTPQQEEATMPTKTRVRPPVDADTLAVDGDSQAGSKAKAEVAVVPHGLQAQSRVTTKGNQFNTE